MMETGQLLDIIGILVTQLKGYAAKLPAVVHLAAVPGGLKPKPEAVDAFEQTISRLRTQVGTTPYRRLVHFFTDALEAFETGKLLATVQPLLAVLDHLEQMQGEKEIAISNTERKRMGEYRTGLNRILPGNEPELEGAGKGL